MRLIVLLLLGGCSGWSCEPEPAAAADAGARAVALPVAAPAAPPARAVGALRQRLAPVAVSEASPLLDPPAGARVMEAPHAARAIPRIETSWCFEAGSPAEIGEALRAALAGAGWGAVSIVNRAGGDRLAVSGLRKPYVLTGTVAPAARGDCAGELAALGVHKVTEEPVPPGEPPQPRLIGPRGPATLRGAR